MEYAIASFHPLLFGVYELVSIVLGSLIRKSIRIVLEICISFQGYVRYDFDHVCAREEAALDAITKYDKLKEVLPMVRFSVLGANGSKTWL